MISNNQGFLSPKIGIVTRQNSMNNYSSNPQYARMKQQLDAKIRQSHYNLFNFIRDNLN